MNRHALNHHSKMQAGPRTTPPPVAPPVHQGRMAPASASRPPAPAVYRPQTSVQRALPQVAFPRPQRTQSVVASIPRPTAPAVYRPQTSVQRAVPQVALPLPQQAQRGAVSASRVLSLAPAAIRPAGQPVAGPSVTPWRSPLGQAVRHQQQFAIQPFAAHLRHPPQYPAAQTNPSAFLAGGVVQPYGQVIQPWSFWDVAGYVTDAISSVTTVSGIISAFVVASGATGWGWLVPLLLPAVGTLINTLIGIRAKRTGNEAQLGQKDAEWIDWLNALLPFIQTAVAAVFGLGISQSDSETLKWIASAITSLLLIAAEALRVNFTLDRDSLYREVWNKIKSCCPGCCGAGERAPLLGNI